MAAAGCTSEAVAADNRAAVDDDAPRPIEHCSLTVTWDTEIRRPMDRVKADEHAGVQGDPGSDADTVPSVRNGQIDTSAPT